MLVKTGCWSCRNTPGPRTTWQGWDIVDLPSCAADWANRVLVSFIRTSAAARNVPPVSDTVEDPYLKVTESELEHSCAKLRLKMSLRRGQVAAKMNLCAASPRESEHMKKTSVNREV